MSPSHKLSGRALLWAVLLICLAVMNAAPAPVSAGTDEDALHWWKGNLHTHTFWSDGDDFPEMVVRWYKEHGYHFLALSDHNRLSRGQRWMVVTYTTRFIGTRRGYDPDSRSVTDAEGKEIRTTRRYSRDVGATLVEVEGTTARYTLKGDEIYVRAKVISSRQNESSHVPGECESAWLQPIVVKQ